EVDGADLEPTGRLVHPHQVAEQVQVPRPPVGGQRHHLVLVAGGQEAQVRGQVLVQQAERVRQFLRGQRFEDAVAVPAGQVAGLLAPAVEDQYRAVAGVLRHRQGGGGGVGDVV